MAPIAGRRTLISGLTGSGERTPPAEASRRKRPWRWATDGSASGGKPVTGRLNLQEGRNPGMSFESTEIADAAAEVADEELADEDLDVVGIAAPTP
jgi:hypothetical protein